MSTLGTAKNGLRLDSAGFSAIELVVVITLIAILAGIAAPSMGTIQARMDTGSARDGFMLYSARARSLAIDRGSVTKLRVDPATDRVVIMVGNTPTDSIDFQSEYGVSLGTDTDAAVVVCYSSRGIAMVSCNEGLAADVVVSFTRSGTSATALLRPLGQVKRQGG